jgi:ElaB/YqjD/DUF883 family membrane-anchored ribosome-binding protein
VSEGGAQENRTGGKDAEHIFGLVSELDSLYRDKLKAKDEEIAHLKDIIALRESALKKKEEEVAALKDKLTDSSEKARRTADELTAQFPQRVVELLQGEYMLKCTKCGAEVKTKVNDEQARQLLTGQPVQLLCTNADCTDEFSWGKERHSIPLTFGPMLRLRLALLGLV